LDPLPGYDLLKLDDAGDDPVAGWEKFFTDRDKYAASPDLKVELFPRRGFLSAYPLDEQKGVRGVKAAAKMLADLATLTERGDRGSRPWLVASNPSAVGGRTAYLGSGELYRLFAYDPPTGRQYYERFWSKLMRYAVEKRSVKFSRGRILLSKE